MDPLPGFWVTFSLPPTSEGCWPPTPAWEPGLAQGASWSRACPVTREVCTLCPRECDIKWQTECTVTGGEMAGAGRKLFPAFSARGPAFPFHPGTHKSCSWLRPPAQFHNSLVHCDWQCESTARGGRALQLAEMQAFIRTFGA